MSRANLALLTRNMVLLAHLWTRCFALARPCEFTIPPHRHVHCRELDREKTTLERQEKKLCNDIKKTAKEGQMVSFPGGPSNLILGMFLGAARASNAAWCTRIHWSALVMLPQSWA